LFCRGNRDRLGDRQPHQRVTVRRHQSHLAVEHFLGKKTDDLWRHRRATAEHTANAGHRDADLRIQCFKQPRRREQALDVTMAQDRRGLLDDVIQQTFQRIQALECLESEWDCSDRLLETVEDTITALEAAGFDLECDANVDCDEEIAKYRAARRIWARHMKEKYNAKNPRSWKLRFHTQTAGCSLTAQQPEINIARTAFQAMAAVLGGTQSLHTNSMDETLALPSEKAAEIALRTQQLIAFETGAANVVDPLGGSWFIEELTNKLEKEAEDYFDKIDGMGGVIPAIEKGYFQREIAYAASEYQRKVDAKRRIVVGVNEFVKENEEIEIPLLKISDDVGETQVEALNKIRSERDEVAVQQALSNIQEACISKTNLMEPIIVAVKAYATMGEIVISLKAEFGEWQEAAVF